MSDLRDKIIRFSFYINIVRFSLNLKRDEHVWKKYRNCETCKKLKKEYFNNFWISRLILMLFEHKSIYNFSSKPCIHAVQTNCIPHLTIKTKSRAFSKWKNLLASTEPRILFLIILYVYTGMLARSGRIQCKSYSFCF